jgi:hypothetical protein
MTGMSCDGRFIAALEREQRSTFRRVLDLSGGVQRRTFLGGIDALPGLRF